MKDTDEEAATAWNTRMQDMQEGFAAAIDALRDDAMLSSDYLSAGGGDRHSLDDALGPELGAALYPFSAHNID